MTTQVKDDLTRFQSGQPKYATVYDGTESVPEGHAVWRTLKGWDVITKAELEQRHAAIGTVQLERMLAASAVQIASSYPVGWPVKHRPALDQVRKLVAADRGLRWTWYRKQGDGPDRPKGCFVFDHADGTAQVFLTVDDLAREIGTASVKATRKPVVKAAPKDAEVVAPAPVVEIRGDLPEAIEEWLARLVFGPKCDYARAYAAAIVTGSQFPVDPGTDWARKARVKVDRLARQQVAA